jgi:kumamolisin
MSMSRIVGWALCALAAYPFPSACAENRALAGYGASAGETVRLPARAPRAPAKAKRLGRVAGESRLRLSVSLPLRNPDALQALLKRLYDPGDPSFGRYLTPDEFARRFGPSQADYEAVADYFAGKGFKIARRHANRLLLTLEGRADVAEAAFDVRLHRYRDASGREFRAPDRAPALPKAIAARLLHISGLDDAAPKRPHLRIGARRQGPSGKGSGPMEGLSPTDIASAYRFPEAAQGASGQTLALLELEGYDPADVEFYRSFFGLGEFPIERIPVDGGVETQTEQQIDPGSEATLDIELLMAASPPGSRLLVYEGPNTPSGFLDIFNAMATDNRAQSISCSWGASEGDNDPGDLRALDQILQQMAAQGQSFFAAAGDNGAFDDGFELSVDDPASQPYATGVGGTRLSLRADGAYGGETVWNGGSVFAGAGGGGVSSVWRLPDYQLNLDAAASKAMRNVPDVALNADPDTGYSIYYVGDWTVFGGTSAAAPLWAAFAAHVNQRREALGLAPLGFANPFIYRIGASERYNQDFHDIADGSNNLYYPALKAYDNAVGWGSLDGFGLLADLSAQAPPPPKSENGPAISLLAPNGGETLQAGALFHIRWTSSGINPGTSLTLSFSKDSGAHWKNLKSKVGVTGYYPWIPRKTQLTDRGVLRLCLAGAPASAATLCDVNDGYFSIGQ